MKRMMVLSLICVIGLGFAALGEVHYYGNFNVGGNVEVFIDNDNAHSEFQGGGSWSGEMWASSQGTYLDTDVDVVSASPAYFNFSAWQNLSGYTNDQIVANAWAGGPESAAMNLRLNGSMYVVGLERHDTSDDLLSASGAGYGTGFDFGVRDGTSEVYSALGVIAISDDAALDGGSGTIDTNQWHSTATGSYGWGNPNNFTTPGTPGYYVPTNTATGTGSGVLSQGGFGNNSFFYNADYIMSGGGAAGVDSFGNPAFYFNDGIHGTWYMGGN